MPRRRGHKRINRPHSPSPSPSPSLSPPRLRTRTRLRQTLTQTQPLDTAFVLSNTNHADNDNMSQSFSLSDDDSNADAATLPAGPEVEAGSDDRILADLTVAADASAVVAAATSTNAAAAADATAVSSSSSSSHSFTYIAPWDAADIEAEEEEKQKKRAALEESKAAEKMAETEAERENAPRESYVLSLVTQLLHSFGDGESFPYLYHTPRALFPRVHTGVLVKLKHLEGILLHIATDPADALNTLAQTSLVQVQQRSQDDDAVVENMGEEMEEKSSEPVLLPIRCEELGYTYSVVLHPTLDDLHRHLQALDHAISVDATVADFNIFLETAETCRPASLVDVECMESFALQQVTAVVRSFKRGRRETFPFKYRGSKRSMAGKEVQTGILLEMKHLNGLFLYLDTESIQSAGEALCHAQLLQLPPHSHFSSRHPPTAPRLLPAYSPQLGYFLDGRQFFDSASSLKKHLQQIDRIVTRRKKIADFGLEL